MPVTAPDAADFCAELVHREDRDRFLCTMFAAPSARRDLYALYAFYRDVSRVPAVVSEPLIGHMRLQWWRDRLDDICHGDGAPVGHPVGQALAAAIARHAVQRARFDPLLDAIGNVLDGIVPDDVAALERQAEAMTGSVVALSLTMLGVTDTQAAAAGRHVGIAWHLLGSLRAIPYREAAGSLPFPLSWGDGGAADGATPAGWLTDCVSRLADVATGHVAAAREQGGAIPRAALPALLPATLADGYLHRLRRTGFDLHDAGLRATAAGGIARLGWNAWRGRF